MFILIFSVCLVVPLSVDIFLSGLPAMQAYFHGGNIGLLLSIMLFGLAIAQPIYGPLLDRFGRRPVLLTGLWIYTIASAAIMLSTSFPWLLIFRFIQALGACSAIISVFAIARDTHSNEKLINATSLIMGMIAVSPAVSPLIGSVLNTLWGWRASFIFLFLIGILYTFIIQFFYKESIHQKNMFALKIKHIINNYFTLAKYFDFLKYCLTSGFSYGVLFSFFGMSPIFIIQHLHFHLISYGLIVASNAIAIIVMAIFAPRLARQITVLKTMQIGLVVMCSGGIIMWLSNLYFINNIYTFMLPMFLTTLGIGMIRPTASAGALQLAPHAIAGSAAACFNFISFVGGSITTVLTTKYIDHISMYGLFITLMGVTALLLQTIRKSKKSDNATGDKGQQCANQEQ